MFNQIFCDDCQVVLESISSETVDLTVTSPPYDSLRDYEGYSFPFFDIAEQLFRVTKKGGVVVWVVGDQTINGSESGNSFRQALDFQRIGFNIHDTMIYEKHNFSNPSKNRYHQIFEYMFIFSKGKPSTFHPIKDVKNKMAGKWGNWAKTNTVTNKDGSRKERPKRIVSELGMRRNIWRYVTSKRDNDSKLAYNHPAIFPYLLAYDHIFSWSNPGDLVFDPMMGSGTTILAAHELNRKFIGCDVSLKYCELAQKRFKQKFNINIDII